MHSVTMKFTYIVISVPIKFFKLLKSRESYIYCLLYKFLEQLLFNKANKNLQPGWRIKWLYSLYDIIHIHIVLFCLINGIQYHTS